MVIVPELGSIVWRTSSYSTNEGDCVEIGWRKSSYSEYHSACIEVAPVPKNILVRDSKNPAGPALVFPTLAWHAFLTTLTP